MIRRMRQADYRRVLLLNQVSVEVLSPLDTRSLHNLVELSHLALVVELDSEVVAFMIVLGPNLSYSSVNYQWFCNHYENFFYVDRIVVDRAFRGKGLANDLYRYLKERCVKCSLVAEIDIEPPNKASLEFHQSQGFIEIGRLIHSDVKTVSLQAYRQA